MQLGRPFLASTFVFILMSLFGAECVGGDSDGRSPPGFLFYAEYQRVCDAASLQLREIQGSALSGDGEHLVVWGQNQSRKLALFMLRSDGSGVSAVPIPDQLDGIWEATVNRNGSRAFFRHHWDKAIYKLEGGALRKIFDADDHDGVGSCDQIQTTGDGEWVYFLDPRRSIWRVRHQGGAPQRIVVDENVPRDGGRAFNIGQFRVSRDGATVAFVVNGFLDDRGTFLEKQELFVWHGGKTRQLTNEPENVYKTRIAISGDGGTIAFTNGRPHNTMSVISSDGRDRRDLDDIVNVGPVALSGDGSRLFYYDTAHNGGRLAVTDGSAGVDLFPAYNVRAIALHAPWSLMANESGDRIGFRFESGVYVGHLNRPGSVADAPEIRSIRLEPTIAGAADVSSGTVANAAVNAGPNEVIRTSVNTLLDGFTKNDRNQLPVLFLHSPNDAGHPPDAAADDGVFASAGQPGGDPSAVPRTRVRVGVMDRSSTVVVADASLSTGGTLAGGTSGLGGQEQVRASAWEVTADQHNVLGELGRPQTFTLIGLPDESGGPPVRYETWTYFDARIKYIFVDGQLAETQPVEALIGRLIPTPYFSEQFALGSDVAAVGSHVDEGQLSVVTLFEGLFDASEFYSGPQLLAGFEEGKLMILESPALLFEETAR